MGIRRRSWGRTKPPVGTPLNRRDPINVGAVGIYVFNEGCGSLSANCAYNNRSKGVVAIPGTSWGNGRDGHVFVGDAATTYVDIGLSALPSNLNLTGNMTILASVFSQTRAQRLFNGHSA
jgi:hypothetical protein